MTGMKLELLLLVQFLLVVEGQDNINKLYEPWRSLYTEGEQLRDYFLVNGLDLNEQEKLPLSQTVVFKMVLEDFNFTADSNTIEYNSLEYNSTAEFQNMSSQLVEAINSSLNWRFKNATVENITIVSYRDYRKTTKPLAFGYIQMKGDENEFDVADFLEEEMKTEQTIGMKGSLIKIHRGAMSVTRGEGLEKFSVLELAIQLLNEPWPYGMDNPQSEKRRNITDVMLHLISPEFRMVFGEHYYRTVITQLTRTKKSTVVHANILLDPDVDNIYHATNIWYSDKGYINFGKWQLFPANVIILEAKVVPARYWKYLSDRSYLAPLSSEFTSHDPALLYTLPFFFSLLFLIISFLGTLKFCHWLGFKKREEFTLSFENIQKYKYENY